MSLQAAHLFSSLHPSVHRSVHEVSSQQRETPHHSYPPPTVIVSTFSYLGIILDDNLYFKPHIENLTKKLKLRLCFYFQNKSCFSFPSKKGLVAATFIPLLDDADVLYMNACSTSLHMLDVTYHCALIFITGCKPLTHHCTLYDKVGCLSFSTGSPSSIKHLLGCSPHTSSYSLHSLDFLSDTVPRTRSEFGLEGICVLCSLCLEQSAKITKTTGIYHHL